MQHLWNWLRGTVGPEIKKLFITLICYHSGIFVTDLCIRYVAQFQLEAKKEVRLNEGMGERRGWEQRDGFRAGEGFPSRRLWLIVPFCSCTHRTGLSNCSSEWGHCLSATQGGTDVGKAGFCPGSLGVGREEGNAA